jgi:S-DNA-T family DNA segregation ATPase FtsK/SpoIIIE
VRIEAPIPGRNVVGIEVPNLEVAAVRLRDVLESPAFQREASPLAVALGKDVAGAPVVAALDRMPHLLIAGATGSGKSVCINAIIASLLFRATPDRVRLLLIDPKVVELGQYDGLPHLLAPVVTDPREAYGALTWVIREMEGRYHRFAERGARDITRYNALLDEGEEPLPYVVVVIDELADLMMVASTKVEDAIARLAQMARAAGIHLVVATQRPSVDVITGLIKANIPSRLAFAVSSQVDSRTILDSGGAEKLLGRGDMLFSPMGAAKPIRAQGALVTEGEVEALIAYVRAQAQPRYEDEVIRSAQAAAVDEEPPEEDPLFADALRVVIEAKGASASLLQRRLRVGYSRAARLVDAMADRGYVGPPDGARPRQVRLTMAEYGRLFADRQLGEPAEPPPDPPV